MQKSFLKILILIPKKMAEEVDLIITCLPSPAACAAVMERQDGIIAGLSEGKIWLEMSTTDASEVLRLANIVEAKSAKAWTARCQAAATGRPPAIFLSLPVVNVRRLNAFFLF